MKIEDQVCTIEQSKKLPLIHNTIYRYVIYEALNYRLLSTDNLPGGGYWWYPAYTVAELGVLLPAVLTVGCLNYSLTTEYMAGKCLISWDCANYTTYEMDQFEGEIFIERTEAQARAAALIWLIDNNHVKAEDLEL
jgi:hypothetical protein